MNLPPSYTVSEVSNNNVAAFMNSLTTEGERIVRSMPVLEAAIFKAYKEKNKIDEAKKKLQNEISFKVNKYKGLEVASVEKQEEVDRLNLEYMEAKARQK